MSDVYLKDADGTAVLYEGIDTVILQGADGEEITFTEGGSSGGDTSAEITTTDLSIELDFSDSEIMEFTPDDGTAYGYVSVAKPDGLASENIVKDVTIAGVEGSVSVDEEAQDLVDAYFTLNVYLYGAAGFATVSPDMKILRVYGVYNGDLSSASTCAEELLLVQDTSLLYFVSVSDSCQPVYMFETFAQTYYAYASAFNEIFTQGDTVMIGGAECTTIPEITTQETWSDFIAMMAATIPEDLGRQSTQFDGSWGSMFGISGAVHWRLPFVWEIYSDGAKVDEFVLEFNLTTGDDSEDEEE